MFRRVIISQDAVTPWRPSEPRLIGPKPPDRGSRDSAAGRICSISRSPLIKNHDHPSVSQSVQPRQRHARREKSVGLRVRQPAPAGEEGCSEEKGTESFLFVPGLCFDRVRARVCVCELANGCMYCIFFLAQERVLGPRSSSPVAVERMLHHEHPYILKQGMGSPYSARIERIGLDFLRLNHAWLSCFSPIQLFSFFNHCMGGSERLRSSR